MAKNKDYKLIIGDMADSYLE